MKILAITGNPKNYGALSALTDEAIRGASESGAEVELIRTYEKNIGFCKFCNQCREDMSKPYAKCSQRDDMDDILPKIIEADGFILACPMSTGQANACMKTFVERCVFTVGGPTREFLWFKGIPESRMKDRQKYAMLITTTGVIPSWLKCFFRGPLKEMKELAQEIYNADIVGEIFAGGLSGKKLKKRLLRKSYSMGSKLAIQTNVSAKGFGPS